jgi:hypothetical protein
MVLLVLCVAYAFYKWQRRREHREAVINEAAKAATQQEEPHEPPHAADDKSDQASKKVDMDVASSAEPVSPTVLDVVVESATPTATPRQREVEKPGPISYKGYAAPPPQDDEEVPETSQASAVLPLRRCSSGSQRSLSHRSSASISDEESMVRAQEVLREVS